MTKRHDELSSAGARRRDQMLPLLQDAIRTRVRRRRQRRAVACSVLALVVMIGLVEVFELQSSNQRTPQTLVADRGPEATPATPSFTRTNQPLIDIQPFDPAEHYAQALERDSNLIITTPTELRADQRTPDSTVVIAYVTTDQLMMELAMAGMDSAIICSTDSCRLFTSAPAGGRFADEAEINDREL